jgi:hypothetical protein
MRPGPHTIGVKVNDDRSCNPARDEVDVAGERVGIALPGQRPAEFGAIDRVAEETVTPGFAAGWLLPAIQGNRSGRARRKGQCGCNDSCRCCGD